MSDSEPDVDSDRAGESASTPRRNSGDDKPSTETPDDGVIGDDTARIKFHFQARSLLEATPGVDEASPYLAERTHPMGETQELVTFDFPTPTVTHDDVTPQAALTPMGISVELPLRRVTSADLEDKYLTATTYLDKIVDDSTAHVFTPAIIIQSRDAVGLFNEYEETIRRFGMEQFDLDVDDPMKAGETENTGSNSRVKIEFNSKAGVQL